MIDRRTAIVLLSGVGMVTASANGQTVTNQLLPLDLDMIGGFEIWYQGQRIVLTSAEIFLAIGGHPMIEEKPEIKGPR